MSAVPSRRCARPYWIRGEPQTGCSRKVIGELEFWERASGLASAFSRSRTTNVFPPQLSSTFRVFLPMWSGRGFRRNTCGNHWRAQLIFSSFGSCGHSSALIRLSKDFAERIGSSWRFPDAMTCRFCRNYPNRHTKNFIDAECSAKSNGCRVYDGTIPIQRAGRVSDCPFSDEVESSRIVFPQNEQRNISIFFENSRESLRPRFPSSQRRGRERSERGGQTGEKARPS